MAIWSRMPNEPSQRGGGPVLSPPQNANVSLGSLLVPERLSIWAWVLGYTAILTSLSVLRSELWLTTGFDLGLYEQGLWQLVHQGLRAATTYTGQPILAEGGSWILILLAPLYALGGTGLLFALQSFFLGLGYLLIRRIGSTIKVPAGTSHLIGVIYLLYPTLIGANLFDFHPTTLAVPLLFGIISAALENRRATFAVLLLLCFSIQASVVTPLIAVGIVLLLLQRPVWGFGTVGLALVGVWTDTHALLPILADVHMSIWSAMVPSGVPLAVSPTALGHSMTQLRTWEYLMWIGGPSALVLLTGRPGKHLTWALPAVAVIAANLLSTSPANTSPFSYPTLMALPFLFTAILGMQTARPTPAGRYRTACLVLPVLALAAFFWHDWRISWSALPPNTDALLTATALIPARAPVVVQNFSAPDVSDRAKVWLPAAAAIRALPKGTYILLDNRFSLRFSSPGDLHALSVRVAADKETKVAFSSNGVRLYELLAALPQPSHPV